MHTLNSPSIFAKLRFSHLHKIKLVMQNEANECGLACLTMIANYYGNGIRISELRQALQGDGQGLNLKTLIEQAQNIALSSRPLKVPLEELSHLQTPCILHWDFAHFVVLEKVSKRGIFIADPASGKRFITMEEVSELFTGVALELKPNQSFTHVKASIGLRLRDFAQNVIGLKRQLSLLLMLSLILQLFAILGPFYMQTVVDEVLIKSDEALLGALAMGFGLVLLIDTGTSLLRERIMLSFSTRFSVFLSSSVFAHLLSLPLPYFMRRHIGDVVSRFDSVQHIRELISSGIVTAIIDGLMALVTLAVMLAYSVKLTLIVIAVVAIYACIRWGLFYPIRRLNQELLHADAEQQSYFMQSVRAIRRIKLSNTSARSHAKWLNKLSTAMNKRIALANWNMSFSSVNKLLFGIENILVVYLAAMLVMEQSLSVGMLFAFVSYKTRFVDASASLIEKFIEFKMLGVHLERVSDIVLTKPELSDRLKAQQSLQISRIDKDLRLGQSASEQGVHIRVSKLAYSYGEGAAPVFSNVSFTLKAGESLAIVGQSGCGKSTLLNCLLGLFTPSEGEIEINGHALRPENRDAHSMAAVLQDDQLLSGSILENITQFESDINLERAIVCAQIACIHNDIMQMTMQYQSSIGDMGDALSGGQKQRLLIARALYQQPSLLLLDEASSHLDIETERQLNQHLQALNISKIMIAHRSETIASAQHIIKLSRDGGQYICAQTDSFTPKPKDK